VTIGSQGTDFLGQEPLEIQEVIGKESTDILQAWQVQEELQQEAATQQVFGWESTCRVQEVQQVATLDLIG